MTDEQEDQLRDSNEKALGARDRVRDLEFRCNGVTADAFVTDMVAKAIEALPAHATLQQVAAAEWRAVANGKRVVRDDAVRAWADASAIEREATAAHNALVEEIRKAAKP